jgi:hypothetical protein
MAKMEALRLASGEDFTGTEYDCDYDINSVEIITPPNIYIDEKGNPYTDESWPAGGGLHRDCEFNADALYAYYVIKDRDKITDYLVSKRFKRIRWWCYEEIWVKGNTKIVYESYDNGAQLWGYMHTELIK